MSANVVVNRAPVLTLWAAVVAERLGYRREEALALGRALAGLNAQSKGRRLGIFSAPPAKPTARGKGPARAVEGVPLLGRLIPVKKAKDGVRALSGDSVIDPEQVRAYLERAFGEHLGAVRDAMERLARSWDARKIDAVAFGLYEQFRPQVASGTRGWGQKGTLEIEKILSLAPKA